MIIVLIARGLLATAFNSFKATKQMENNNKNTIYV